MQVNCTVFIQAINFFITYIFLRKLLFKPVVQVITQKNLAKKILLSNLKEKELCVQTLFEKKSRDLENFRNSIKTKYHAPEITKQKMDADILEREKIEISQSLVDSCKNLIVKEIPDAL